MNYQKYVLIAILICFQRESNIKKKFDLRIIISIPHAQLQTMTKTSVKFQKDWHKTVRGVAHTWYPLSIHFDSIQD